MTSGFVQIAFAQAVTETSRLAAIQGTIRNEVSGEPLRKAFVRLTITGKTLGYSAITNERGEFALQKVEPGNYNLHAECFGFIPSESVAEQAVRLEVRAGERITGIRVALTPQATVSGRVLDEEGDPMVHGGVGLFRSVWANGRREIRAEDGGALDDRGEFRIANIKPGRYYLSADPDIEWELRNRPEPSANMRLQRTWYPSAPDASRATLLQIEPGRQLTGLEIRLRRSSVHRISGRLSNMEAIPPLPAESFVGRSISARSVGSQADYSLSGTIAADNSFEISSAPPGTYWITVRQGLPPVPLGEVKVEVRDDDVDDVSIALQPPHLVKGVVKTDSEAPIDLAELVVILSNGWNFNVRPRADVTFETPLLGIDRYAVRAMSTTTRKPAYVKHVRYGETESKDGFVMLTPGDAELVVVVSSHGAQITGIVRRNENRDGMTDVGAATPRVVLISKAGGAEPRFSTVGQTDAFTFENLPPGEYRLFAFESSPDGVWEDPEFLKELASKAENLALKELEQKSMTVPLLRRAELTPILRKLGIE